MSPRIILKNLTGSSADDTELVTLLADVAHELWMTTVAVTELQQRGRLRSNEVAAVITELAGLLAQQADRVRLAALVDKGINSSQSLSSFLASLPKYPGLCFPAPRQAAN